MRAFWILWNKELNTYFLSPIAYIVMIFFLVVMGSIFMLLVSVLAEAPPGVSIMSLLFGSPFFWMTMLAVAPVLTMRLFAEEKKTGTIETLLTAPVGDAAVVLAKFAGAVSFYICMWLPTLFYLVILQYFSASMAPLDPGPVIGGYVGALLVGMLYLSIGLWCSSLTTNQIVAAIISFAILLALFLGGLLEFVVRSGPVREIAAYISSYSHLMEMSRGVIDSRPVVFYLSGTALMLFATAKTLESRSWK